MVKKFPHYKQLDLKDCGPTCLKIIAKYYGKTTSIIRLRELSETTRVGSSLLGISNAAEKMGFRTLSAKVTMSDLVRLELPCILHWNSNHFVVLYRCQKRSGWFNRKSKNFSFFISDPAFDLIEYKQDEFLDAWIGKNANESYAEGIVLLLEPTPLFFENEDYTVKERGSLSSLLPYVSKFKGLIIQLILGLILGSIIQLIFPFLTQSVVDVGIETQNINFVHLVLLAQLALFIGRTSVEVIRSWILLHVSTRINISLVSDFFVKLMKLPISYFDTKMTGDILQRINDHKRIERLLTSSSLNVLFSAINLLVFGAVLAYYSISILLIFAIGVVLYFVWVLFFFKKREVLDHKQFSHVSDEQSKVIELINGMQSIKMNNAERNKRWGWEFLQIRLFKISIEELRLEQYQTVGSDFINELKNILITFFSAKLVIEGEITLGMMLAISYIVGQLNSPIGQLIGFLREYQDASISLQRLNEIHRMEDEESNNDMLIKDIAPGKTIDLTNVSFRYPGSPYIVLDNIDLSIPGGKITAIVGTSGSGKTTLMKLLLKYYSQTTGNIKLGGLDLNMISHQEWRKKCGVVMQEDFIFNDTIANNVAVGEERINKTNLKNAVKIANVKDFIETLPLSYNTKIGNEGMGLSTGQKQRILIARAVYKNPDYFFFDEATSALDANNEKEVVQNMNRFFSGKTVVIVAHRLSTVKKADQIIVMESGNIVEIGCHDSLIKEKGNYYNLVKNQLELGT